MCLYQRWGECDNVIKTFNVTCVQWSIVTVRVLYTPCLLYAWDSCHTLAWDWLDNSPLWPLIGQHKKCLASDWSDQGLVTGCDYDTVTDSGPGGGKLGPESVTSSFRRRSL